jgi:hypothetical protein
MTPRGIASREAWRTVLSSFFDTIGSLRSAML